MKHGKLSALLKTSAIVCLLLLSIASCSVAFKVFLAYRQAGELMGRLSRVRAGVSGQAEALEKLKSFEGFSADATDCLGGPCLNGKIYEIRRSRFPFTNLYPPISLKVGLFFSHGVLVLKHIEFKQEYQRYNPGLDIIEYEFPFPERHSDADIVDGYRMETHGTFTTVFIDQRAAEGRFIDTYDINLRCFLNARGCPCSGKLRSTAVECKEAFPGTE